MAKGKGGKGGGTAKGNGAPKGGGESGRKGGGKGKGSKDGGTEEKTEGGSAARMASKAYKAALDDVTGNTQVRVSDFDIKAVHLLDYLQKNGGRAGEALTYLKKAAQGVQRDDILNWRAYVYTLLRKFDENAYKAMKAQSTDRVANNRERAGGDAAVRGSSTPPPPKGAPGDGVRPQGDASERQPPAPPPLQDYLAQAGFFAHPPGPPAPPPPATPAPGAQDLELSAKAKEFVPGKTWDGRLVGCTPQVPAYPATMPGFYPPPYYPPYPGYGYPGVPPVAPPYPAAMPAAGGEGKKGGGQRRGGGGERGERSGGGGGKKGKGGGDRAATDGKGAQEAKAPADSAAADGGATASDGDQKEASAGQPPKWSAGSAGHDTQECKPCAFYHTKGCSSGEQCQFCHMCGPGEKKKRKKEAVVTPKEGQK